MFWVVVSLWLSVSGCTYAEAQSCSRECPASEKDVEGCCPAPVKKSGGTTTSGASSPSGFGKRASSAGCKTGLVNEGGVCCWPGQGWTGSACVGTPTCPDGLVASGDTCAAPGCPSGQVKQSGGQCCWPGQVWSSSGGKCVGTAQCPAGFVAEGDASCVSPEEVAARAAAALRAPADWSSPTLGVFKGIPGGTFTMGSPSGESGRDADEAAHSVTLTRGFWLMEHEVTQGEWESVMGSNPIAEGTEYWGGGHPYIACSKEAGVGATLPVACVSWPQAVEFAQRASARDGVTYRLPTESEWERAARGGGASVYAGSESLDAVGWYDGNSGGKSRPVCGRARNGYGLCDMSGNVGEWVQDWYGDYPAGSVSDPAGPLSGSFRVSRGGSWLGDPAGARVADRGGSAPSSRYVLLGFRLARSVP